VVVGSVLIRKMLSDWIHELVDGLQARFVNESMGFIINFYHPRQERFHQRHRRKSLLRPPPTQSVSSSNEINII